MVCSGIFCSGQLGNWLSKRKRFYVYIGNKFYLHITLNFDKHKHIAVVASLHMT